MSAREFSGRRRDELGAAAGGRPVLGSRRAWIAGRAIALDVTGKRARWALSELPRRYAGAVLRAVRAGLGSLDFAHVWAREVVSLAVMVFRASIRARRRGFARVTRGLARGWFASALVNPQTGSSYSISTLFGSRPERRPAPSSALAAAGAFYRVQPPANAVDADELGPSGWACGQFWLPAGPELDVDAELVAALRGRSPALTAHPAPG